MSKIILYIILVTAAFLSTISFVSAKQLDPEKEPNFSYTIVDSTGASVHQPAAYLYPSGKPTKSICVGLCAGWDMYLEPGLYNMVVETLHVKDIRIEEGKKLDKVIVYDRKIASDPNFSLITLDENGRKLHYWYLLYNEENPKEIFCFCEIGLTDSLKLPKGTYEMKIGFLRKLKVSGIIIDEVEGKKLNKIVMLPFDRSITVNKRPLMPINKGPYLKAIPKIFIALQRAMRQGNNIAIHAFVSQNAPSNLAERLSVALGNKPILFRPKILRFEEDASTGRIKVETIIIRTGEILRPRAYFIFEKYRGEWFIVDTDFDTAFLDAHEVD